MLQQESIAGSCLCGSVRFEIKPPSTGFRYCHCNRCQKASGGLSPLVPVCPVVR